jgi:transcriptional regulator with XRE-family HTH domain
MIDMAVVRGCARRAERLVRETQVCEQVLDRLLRPLPPMLPIITTGKGAIATLADSSDQGILAYAVAQRLRFERMQRGWTQEDLATRTGIARPNVARLERGTRLPAMTTLRKMAIALELDLDALLRAPVVTAADQEEDRDLAEAGMADWSEYLDGEAVE